jgi:hypothetical protein
MPGGEPNTEAEKIRILLAEHASLRAEIVARMSHIYQMIGFGITAILLLVTLASTLASTLVSLWRISWISWSMIALVVFIVFVFAFGMWWFVAGSLLCAQRIREIELDVNDRAQEDLLIWENLWGSGATGSFLPRQPLPRSHLERLKPPPRTWRGEPITTRNSAREIARGPTAQV